MTQEKTTRHQRHILRRILIILLILTGILAASFFIYTGQYYHAGNTAEQYMQEGLEGASDVRITAETDGWLFDGPGNNPLIIFYPGAKVQSEAYAPILYRAAESGYDCFLVKMPFHLAVFGMNKAESVMEQYPEYDSYYMSGHSLGGAMAGNFAAGHTDQIEGVIFLAAYPTKSLQGMKVLSVYGSEDGVLNRDRYKESLPLMPENFTEYVIRGGNHGQFGDYGTQKGDGKASVTAQVQWEETVEAIDRFMKK